MRAPRIDFAPRAPARNLTAYGVLLIATVVCAWVLWHYFEARGRLQRIEVGIAAAADAAERRRSTVAPAAGPLVPPLRINAVNSAIARLNIPWSELFAAFEAERPEDVALLALLPDARKRSLIVQAEATTPAAMVQFVERLRAVALFEDAFLVKHERREQDSGQPYRFAVEVRWKDAP